jgi:CHAD domain-containing protein
MSEKKRHRLRLMNKKLCYSIEFFADLFPNRKSSRQPAALKVLRKAQKSLGQLNDDAKGRSLALCGEMAAGRLRRFVAAGAKSGCYGRQGPPTASWRR